ncbi:UNVERIFIED_CONTAM: hypothetical protein FKN15_075305, partial [Acipenser sinensis]
NSLLKKFPASQATSIKEDFLIFYQYAFTYLTKWFDFSDENHLKQLLCLALNKEFNFSELCEAVEALRMSTKLDMDALYDEFCVVLPCLKEIATSTDPRGA